MTVIALAGRPNTGKTTLFNALTGSSQRIANFAGSTVERAIGTLKLPNGEVQVIDLPGTTTLLPKTEDEAVAIRFIEAQARGPFTIFCVAEASNLEHDVVLALMLHRLGYAVTLVLNMIDEAEKNGLTIDVPALEREIGFPVVATSARYRRGLGDLKRLVAESAHRHANSPTSTSGMSNDDFFFMQNLATEDARRIAGAVVQGFYKTKPLPMIARAIAVDRLLLHPIVGPIFFIAVMFFLFQSIFTWAAPLTALIDQGLAGFRVAIERLPFSPTVGHFLSYGVLAGIGAVLTFIPQIAILFLLIGFLEKTGYLPRAAALVDRLLRPFGLEGKAFIPLLSSFACAIPGIMATRTLDSEKRRLTTILIAPLMTCSARLPVYTLIVSAFVPADLTLLGFGAQGLVMAGMYFLAIVLAMGVALVLRLLKFSPAGGSHAILLPPFRMPRLAEVFHYSMTRSWLFLKKAGRVIFVVSLLLWLLASFPKIDPVPDTSQPVTAAQQIEQSYLGKLGKTIQPIFAPLGYDWRLSVGILTAFAAREVFVGTLGTIFALESRDLDATTGLVEKLQTARTAEGEPYTLATAVSLLLFFAIALQCISTLAITARETGGWHWPIVQMTYLWTLAYGMSFLGYRITVWAMP